MKKYYNSTTNKWYYEGNTITVSNEGTLFSGVPTEEQLLAWGYEEWHEPEPTQEELLQRAKNSKLAEIETYDASEEVNSFTIGGQTMWLTVAERQQIATQISASEAIGRETMTRWFNGMNFTFPLNVWKQMLVALEVYAGDAINVTEAHKADITALESIEDVEDYDFTVGYPNNLEF